MSNKTLTENILTPQSVGDIFNYISNIMPDPDKILRENGYNYAKFRDLIKEPFFDGVWEKRIGNLVRNKFYFIPPDESSINKDIVTYFENWFNKQNLHTFYSGFLDAVLFGYSPNEIIYRNEKYGSRDIWGIKSVEQKPQEWIGFNDDGIPMKRKGFFQYEDLEDYKFIITRHYNTYINPYGKKMVSILFWMLVFKKGGWRFFTIFIEKFGGASAFSAIPEAKYQDSDFRDDVLNSLDELCSGGVGVFPEGCETTLIESKDKGGSSELYKTYIEMIDKNISICILGETLSTSQGETGARAATQVHNEVRKEKSDIDMSIVEPAINQIIKYFSILNFGVTDTIPVFIFEREAELNLKLVERDEKLVKTYNIEFDEEYVEVNYGIDRKYFKKKEVQTHVKEPLNSFKKQFADDFSNESKEDKQLKKEDKLLNEFGKKQAVKFQDAYNTIIDEIIDSIEDVSDTNQIFSSIMKKYPELNFDEITGIIDNVRFASSQIGAYSENRDSKKKSSLLALFSTFFQKMNLMIK